MTPAERMSAPGCRSIPGDRSGELAMVNAGCAHRVGRRHVHNRRRRPLARVIGRATAARMLSSVPTTVSSVWARVTAV